MRRVAIVIALTAAVASTVRPCAAQQSGAPAEPTTRAAHVYLRLAAGAGVYVGPKNELYGVWYGGWGGGVVQSTSTVAGLAFPFEAALGGPIAENLALGGGLYGAAVPLLERNADPRAVGLIGPMIDYYWDDFDGVHTELAAGVGTTVEEKTKIDKLRGAAGLAAGIGYEWRASARWNVGGLFRVLALIEEQPTVVPGLLFTGTYL